MKLMEIKGEITKKYKNLLSIIAKTLNFDNESLLEDFNVYFKRVDKNVMKRKGLYFAHSWAGREVDIFLLVLRNEVIVVPFLESYTNGWKSSWTDEGPTIEEFLKKQKIDLAKVRAIIEVTDETFNKRSSDEFIREIIIYKNN